MEWDTIVIGAGAAGLAAARILQDAGRSVCILEARQRVGGRIWTTNDFADFPIELGAEFIHGEKAVTHDLAASAGLTTIEVDRSGELQWSEGQRALPIHALPPSSNFTIERLQTTYLSLAADVTSPYDRSLGDYLRGCGFDGRALAVADVLLAQTCCASIDTLSCTDLAREMRADRAGKRDYRIVEGYGRLLEWLAYGLEIHLHQPVVSLSWQPGCVHVCTPDRVYTALTCIITVPAAVLQREAIRFDPPLSQRKQRALAATRTEPATKLLYRFRERRWDEPLSYMAHTGTVARWWAPDPGYEHAPVMIGYVTAGRARYLDTLEDEDALALGLRELETLVEASNLESVLLAAKRVAWAHDPYALGGYAHVPPGAANARLELAASERGVLFFAGEATAHETNPQTVHGAVETGWRAARECLTVLPR